MIYSEPERAERLPIVDLSGSFSGDAAARDAVVRDIRSAVCDTGFLYVTGHGVDPVLVSAAFAQARRFLELPLAVKERVRRGPGRRGYEPLEGQATGRGPGGERLAGDLKESFNFGRDRGPQMPSFAADQWPGGMLGFRETLEAYYTALDGLALHLVRLLSLSLDLPADYFAEAFRFPHATCRLLRYPPQPERPKENQMGAGPHTDVGAITILAQDRHEALEVHNRQGTWIRATPVEDSFVVNIADMFPRWTNDRYHSSRHRVMNNTSGTDRYSIVFFYSPAYTTRIECVPTCLPAEGRPAYEPIVFGKFSDERLAASRAHAPVT
jgi:isopenicillin N synthase-like dioxygenase